MCAARTRTDVSATHAEYGALQHSYERAGFEANYRQLPALHKLHQQYQDCLREHLRLYGVTTADEL
jgi:hypothetical protein